MHSSNLIINILVIVFLLTLLTQFVYYFRYFLPLSKYNDVKINSDKPKISILICAHNEEDNIRECVEHILNQQYHDFEVIVVNDRSTDNTLRQLKTFKDQKLKTVCIDEVGTDKSPKKNAITKGFEIAKGEFVLLTDADCKPYSANWISKMVECIEENTDIVLGYSPYSKRSGWLNRLIQFDTFFTAIQYLSFANKGNAYMGVGRNLLIRKDAFVKVNGFKGFENILAGDDDIIVQKIAIKNNIEICLDKDSFVNSKPEFKWLSWFEQKRRHLSVGVNYKSENKWEVGLFQQSFVLMYISFFMLLSIQNLSIELKIIGIILLLIRSLLINSRLAKVLKIKTSFYILPILEILYFFTFLLIGSSVLIKNKRTWR